MTGEKFSAEKVLHFVKKDLDSQIYKLDNEKLSTFLIAATSQLTNVHTNLILTGPPSAGKSKVLKHALEYFDLDDGSSDTGNSQGYKFTHLSAKALIRFAPSKDWTWDNKILAVEEFSGAETAADVLRVFLSEGAARALITESSGKHGTFETKDYVTKGKPTLILTTANDSLEEQFASRCVILPVFQPPIDGTVKFIYSKIASSKENTREYFNDISEYCRNLPVSKVVIPYADALSAVWNDFPNDIQIITRSCQELVAMISASALVHHTRRPKNGKVVYAIGDDYEIVRRMYVSDISKLSGLASTRFKRIETALKAKDCKYIEMDKHGNKLPAFTRESLSAFLNKSMRRTDDMLDVLLDSGLMVCHSRWVSESAGRGSFSLSQGRNPNIYTLNESARRFVVLPSLKYLLNRDSLEKMKLKDLDVDGGVGNSKLFYKPYDAMTGKDIDPNNDECFAGGAHCKLPEIFKVVK